MKRTPAKTTLAYLQKNGGWVWAYCEGMGCGHKAPLAIDPFVIRWGGDKSSDLLRDQLRCSKCGRLGATLQMPGWIDSATGTQPFPVECPALPDSVYAALPYLRNDAMPG